MALTLPKCLRPWHLFSLSPTLLQIFSNRGLVLESLRLVSGASKRISFLMNALTAADTLSSLTTSPQKPIHHQYTMLSCTMLDRKLDSSRCN